MHIRKSVVLVCIFLLAGVSQAAEPEKKTPGLQDLIERALEANPELDAAQARWKMYRHRIPQAESLEDPVFSFAFNNYPVDTLESDQTPMTGRIVKLSQRFPFPGKLALRGDIAEEEAAWYRAVYEDGKLQLIQAVKNAWFTLFYVDRALEVTQRNIDLLKDFIQLTETRYEVGQGLQQDVLRAQVERSQLMDLLFSLRQQRRSALAELNALLDRPEDTPVGVPRGLEATEVAASLEDLQEKAEGERPLYAAYQSLIQKFKNQRALARRNYYPDFSVGAGYTFREDNMVDDGTDFVGLEFSMNLPVYTRKREAAVAEAASGVRMALAQYEDFRNEVGSSLADTYARLEKDRDLLRLYRTGIIPQANQTYQSALSAYQVGKVDALSLLDSLMTLYRYQKDYYRVLADHEKDVARLEAVSGVPLGPGDVIEEKNLPEGRTE